MKLESNTIPDLLFSLKRECGNDEDLTLRYDGATTIWKAYFVKFSPSSDPEDPTEEEKLTATAATPQEALFLLYLKMEEERLA